MDANQLLNKPVLRLADIAALLGRCKRSLHRDVSSGRFPPPDLRLTARWTAWRRETVEAFLRGEKIETRQD